MGVRRKKHGFRIVVRILIILIAILAVPFLLHEGSPDASGDIFTLTRIGPKTGLENKTMELSANGNTSTVINDTDPVDDTIEGFIDHLYSLALGRPADTDGKNYWVKTITDGKANAADCAYAVFGSQEFSGRNLSSEQFLDILYQTFCCREADSAGKSYWLGELNSGRLTRNDVIRSFVDTTEWCNICASFGVASGAPNAKATRPSNSATVFATRLYTCCLKREPELDGLRYWSLELTNLEKSGRDAAQFFFESAEFQAMGTSNKEFLNRLYTTYMGREPEESGMEYWMEQMNTGMGRKQVMSYFAASPEFTALCKKHGLYKDPTPTPAPTYVDLIAVGDNLYHEKIIRSGQRNDGTRNYDGIYAHIKPYIQDAEIKVINQEVLLTGDSSQWSGYPRFSSPLEAGEAVVRAGFNVVTHATNHSWDKGRGVAMDSINFWKRQNGLLLTGMYASQAEYDSIVIGEYDGVKVAFLNYTYGLNGFTLPADSRYMVKLLDMDLVTSEIRRARTMADIVIVFPHWGEEYKTFANAAQKSMAQQMADAGADLIIGCHPHVIQPLEILTSNTGKRVPCYYSLGNFVSNMTQSERCVEAMAKVRIKKDGDRVFIESVEAVPLVNFINAEGTAYTVYPAEYYTEEIARNHRNTGVTPQFVRSFWNQVFANGDSTYLSVD